MSGARMSRRPIRTAAPPERADRGLPSRFAGKWAEILRRTGVLPQRQAREACQARMASAFMSFTRGPPGLRRIDRASRLMTYPVRRRI